MGKGKRKGKMGRRGAEDPGEEKYKGGFASPTPMVPANRHW